MNLPRTSADYLNDITREAEYAIEFVSGYSYETFVADRKTCYAVVRCLLVIGEAAKKVSDPDRARSPDIPWRMMTGMRDRLIHNYNEMRLDVVWSVVETHLPELLPTIRQFRDTLIAEEPPLPGNSDA